MNSRSVAFTVVLCLVVVHVGWADTSKGQENPVFVIQTTHGNIELELFQNDAPKTVANCIGLAEVSIPFTDPDTGNSVKKPFYDGLVFHRVIRDFMIHGGCPLGNGTGGPGYRSADEIDAAGPGLDEIRAINPQKGPHPYLMIQDR